MIVLLKDIEVSLSLFESITDYPLYGIQHAFWYDANVFK